MSKAFTREDAAPDDDFDGEEENPIPAGSKNYVTPAGWQRMRDELRWLVNTERPAVTQVVSWAASLGDRSENADYFYGKKRLREIDRRIRYLTKRLEVAEVVDPATREETDQVFFGATVRLFCLFKRCRGCAPLSSEFLCGVPQGLGLNPKRRLLFGTATSFVSCANNVAACCNRPAFVRHIRPRTSRPLNLRSLYDLLVIR